jgi:AraC-like DNA-binding protein
VKGTFIDSLITSFKLTNSVIVKNVNSDQIIRDIHNLLLTPTINYQQISFKILELFYLLTENLFTPSKDSSQLPEMIRKYLDTSITNKLTLEKISTELNVSVSHIERVFKQRYNITPLNYFMKQKTKYACALLINTSYSVATVAEKSGFSDARYMAKCIKKETGMTPVEYRKNKTHTV